MLQFWKRHVNNIMVILLFTYCNLYIMLITDRFFSMPNPESQPCRSDKMVY